MSIRRILLILCLLVAGLIIFLFLPLRVPVFTGGNAPSRPTYEEAVAGWQRMIADTPPAVREDSRPILMVHGQATETVVVFLHGLSNTPLQFVPLAKILFERGHNVVIQRTPYHGEKDRMATDWGRLTAQQMVESGNQAVDLARGLGRRVVVAGLSINGTTVAWMAQNRSDIDQAVLLSPFMVPNGTPQWATRPMMHALLALPNFFLWWDPKQKENLPGPDYIYPRFPTRVIGQTMLLGYAVLEEARSKPPACPSIFVITSESDIAISMIPVNQLISDWQKSRPSIVQTYAFPKDEKITHDFIDIHQPDQHVDIVYPKLIELLKL